MTRPGGQPDGSSHMGAWGGWALAPDIANGEEWNRSHINWSRHPARRSKSPFDFFNLPRGRSAGLKAHKTHRVAGLLRHFRPIYPSRRTMPAVPSPGSQKCYPAQAQPVRVEPREWRLRRFQRRISLEHEHRDAADERGGTRRAGGDLIFAVRRRRVVGRSMTGFPRYGVSTARLTIFSFCSLPSSVATSSLLIAPLPN